MKIKRTRPKPIPDDGEVHATIKNLKPATTYRYWVVAEDPAGIRFEGRHLHFTTEA